MKFYENGANQKIAINELEGGRGGGGGASILRFSRSYRKGKRLRREEGWRGAISELKTLMRERRIGQNSSDLTRLSGNLSVGGVAKTLLSGRERGRQYI